MVITVRGTSRTCVRNLSYVFLSVLKVFFEVFRILFFLSTKTDFKVRNRLEIKVQRNSRTLMTLNQSTEKILVL